jgi:hypothetical protein
MASLAPNNGPVWSCSSPSISDSWYCLAFQGRNDVALACKIPVGLCIMWLDWELLIRPALVRSPFSIGRQQFLPWPYILTLFTITFPDWTKSREFPSFFCCIFIRQILNIIENTLEDPAFSFPFQLNVLVNAGTLIPGILRLPHRETTNSPFLFGPNQSRNTALQGILYVISDFWVSTSVPRGLWYHCCQPDKKDTLMNTSSTSRDIAFTTIRTKLAIF